MTQPADRNATRRLEFHTGLCLVHGNRPEPLRDLLIAWLRRDPLGPLEDEVVLVQSAGVAQWLRMGMAADVDADAPGFGISAATRMLLPSEFLWSAYRAVLGSDRVAPASPLDKDALAWRLMRLLPSVVATPGFEPVAQFLARDPDLAKRFQLCERLADLFDQYQVYRSDWLHAWDLGHDVLIDARGRRQPLPAHQVWQAQLWRQVLADVRMSHAACGPLTTGGRAAVHQAFLEAVSSWGDQPRPVRVPRRVLMFGVSSLPRQSIEVLAALSRWSQLFICVNNPCQFYWADAVPEKDLLRAALKRHARRPGSPPELVEDDLHLHTNPLLAQWGRQGRDFIGLLSEFEPDSDTQAFSRSLGTAGLRLDCFETGERGTLLGQLQDDILNLRPLHETRSLWDAVDPARDDSVRFHVAHGVQREVEILHDQLLAAFNADPGLRAREVIVMVPDIETYTAHIQAVFGRLDAGDPRHIPFSLADRAGRGADPLPGALEQLLAIGQSRMRVSDVLGLLETPALRRRFGIDPNDLPMLRQWMEGANIRWGLDGAHRRALDLPARDPGPEPNTWAGGLRRMMLGYAAGDSGGGWHGTEPYTEVGGLAAAALGPLVQLVQCLEQARTALSEPRTPQAWVLTLNALLETFFQADDGPDAYTLLQLQSALQRWEQACDEARLCEPLPLSVVCGHWLSGLDAGGLARRFFGGAVTFATLMPMRAIPFRQVYLLGMNDGDYPRSRVPMDFDLMGRDYRPGDRSRREDDRYLFLEAVLSAREKLCVSWVGRSITDNTPRPPSVLVAQLRDHLDAGWKPVGGGALCEALTTWHRLQPFSAVYFPSEAASGPYFTYASEWREAAAARHAGTGAMPAANAQLLDPLSRDEPLSLRELADFARLPVREFFRRRLGIHFSDGESLAPDDEPFELDGLALWGLQDELIRAQLGALDGGEAGALSDVRRDLLEGMRRSGALPPGAFGELEAQRIDEPMAELFEAYAALLAKYPACTSPAGHLDETFTVDGGKIRLVDVMQAPRRSAQGAAACIVVESSALVDGARSYRLEKALRHWVRHLAAQLALGPVTTHVLSKKGRFELAPVEPSAARDWLGELVGAWSLGMRAPLPLSVEAAAAWLQTGRDEPAAAVYDGGFNSEGVRGRDPHLRRAYPDYAALTADGGFYHWARLLIEPVKAALMADARPAQARASGV